MTKNDLDTNNTRHIRDPLFAAASHGANPLPGHEITSRSVKEAESHSKCQGPDVAESLVKGVLSVASTHIVRAATPAVVWRACVGGLRRSLIGPISVNLVF